MATNGPELSRYVTLISSDGFEFVVLREAVYVSGAIKRMLDPKSMSPLNPTSKSVLRQAWLLLTNFWEIGSFAESIDGRCHFEEIKYGYFRILFQ
jgi:hypothetical protein